MSIDDGNERPFQTQRAFAAPAAAAGFANAAEAAMENDMLRAQLMSLRQAYADLQQDKGQQDEAAQRPADSDEVSMLRAQLESTRQAYKQLQEESAATINAAKARENDGVPRPAPPRDSDEVLMLRAQLESTRQAYKQLQEERSASALAAEDRVAKLGAAKAMPAKRAAMLPGAFSIPSMPTSMASALMKKAKGADGEASAPGQPDGTTLEADMMREQMESLRKAYLALQEEHDTTLRELAEVTAREAEAAGAALRAAEAEQQLEELQTTLEELSNAAIQADAEAQDQLKEQQATIIKLNDALHCAEKERDDAGSRAAELAAQVERANAQTMADAYSLEQAQARLMQLQEEMAAGDAPSGGGAAQSEAVAAVPCSPPAADDLLDSSIGEEDSKAAELLARCRELTETLAAVKADAAETLKKHISELAVAKAKISDLVGQMDRLRALSCEEANRTASAKAKASELAAQLEGLKAEVAAAQADASKQADEVSKLTEALRSERDEAAGLRSSVAELASREAEASEEIAKSQQAASDAKDSSEAAVAKAKALEEELEQERNRCKLLEEDQVEQRSSLEAQVAELQAKVEEVQKSSQQQAQERERGLKSHISQLQKEVQNLRTQLEEVEERSRGLQRKLRERDDAGGGAYDGMMSMQRRDSRSSSQPGQGGMLYMVKIEELEAENARLQERVLSGSALWVPKIQQLEADLEESKLELRHTMDALEALQQDVATKATMIRELLNQGSGRQSSSGRLTRLFRARKPSKDVDNDPLARVAELEKILESAILELAHFQDPTQPKTLPKAT